MPAGCFVILLPTDSDYKILARIITSRLKLVINSIVNEDQCAYIPGRTPGMLLRAIDDIMEFTVNNDIDGIMLGIDFSKAFDKISWGSIPAPSSLIMIWTLPP